jgi:hypothetical protein
MRHILTVTFALGLAVAVSGSLLAQAPRHPAPGPSPAPARAAPDRPPVPDLDARAVEGTVLAIDRETRSLRVGGERPGREGTPLQLIDNSEIRVGGRPGSVSEIREGARVKAAYEDRSGINVVRSLEITHP